MYQLLGAMEMPDEYASTLAFARLFAPVHSVFIALVLVYPAPAALADQALLALYMGVSAQIVAAVALVGAASK